MLETLLKKRIILVCGKGGVGRTSVTAALARVAAAKGKRVLVTEIAAPGDDFSPLANLFGQYRFPGNPIPLAPNISGGILLAQVGQEEFFTSVIKSRRVVKTVIDSKVLRRLLSSAPSCREMGILFHFLQHLRQQLSHGALRYELVIVDMPATGHALALTELPEILLKVFRKGPIADALREGQSYVNNPVLTSALVVSLPEKLPVSEALDLIAGLEATHVPVGGMIINRVIPALFSEEELHQLRGALDGKQILGSEPLAQMETSGQALQRVMNAVKIPVGVLRNFSSENMIAQMVEAFNEPDLTLATTNAS